MAKNKGFGRPDLFAHNALRVPLVAHAGTRRATTHGGAAHPRASLYFGARSHRRAGEFCFVVQLFIRDCLHINGMWINYYCILFIG